MIASSSAIGECRALFPGLLSFEVGDQTDVLFVLPDDHADLCR